MINTENSTHSYSIIKCLFQITDFIEKNVSRRFEDTVQLYRPNDTNNWFMYTLAYDNLTQKLSVYINNTEVKSFIKM